MEHLSDENDAEVVPHLGRNRECLGVAEAHRPRRIGRRSHCLPQRLLRALELPEMHPRDSDTVQRVRLDREPRATITNA